MEFYIGGVDDLYGLIWYDNIKIGVANLNAKIYHPLWEVDNIQLILLFMSSTALEQGH